MTPNPPADPIGDAVADALGELLFGAAVSFTYAAATSVPPALPDGEAVARATGPGPDGCDVTIVVRLEPRLARLLDEGSSSLRELLSVLPGAGLRAAARLRAPVGDGAGPAPAVRRAVRDLVAAEVLDTYLAARVRSARRPTLVAETIEYLIELTGTRVEAHDVTHGVVVADALAEAPRLELPYPGALRPAKRAPLLFDGQRSVLVVDASGRARTELQRHRFDRLGGPAPSPDGGDSWLDSGSLVGRATATLGGIGFYVRADRSIWAFADGRPLLVRRGEHWTAFPVELAASIANLIGGGRAADIVARAAYMISTRPQGAILAIVDDADRVASVVSPKDRYDLRNEVDLTAMRPETRLHHLIDAEDLDEHTLARLGALDGATVLDRDARLIAYGAIVTTAGGEHEGARTAAARTLSQTALVVLKISVDGDITIFRHGAAITTLLGHPPWSLPGR